jgi:pilus assembly protein FimV
LRLIVHECASVDRVARKSRVGRAPTDPPGRLSRSHEHIYNAGLYGAMDAQSAMLESAEITLAPGMDRDTAVPPLHLPAAPWPNCLLSATALGLMGIMGLMGNAQALGLGRPQAHSVLGQPLVLSFPLSLRAGESLSLDCVFAEVMAGGSKLPAGKVGVRLEGDSESTLRAIRVLSSEPIEEPILNVTLSLGCPVRLTRQFSALMDPPIAQDGASPDAYSSGESPRVLSPALRAALATSDAKPKELLGANLSDVMGQERLTASKSAAPVTAKAEAKADSKKSAAPNAAARSKAHKVAAAASVELAALVVEPRLRLEAFDANSAAASSSAASAAEAAMARLQQVESGLLGLQSENRSNALKLGAMQQGLAAGPAKASDNSQNALTWSLGALALLLGAGVVYLWRSRSRHPLGMDSNWWGQASHEAVAEAAEPGWNPSSAAPAEAQLVIAASTSAGKEPESPRRAAPDEQTMALPHSVTADFAPLPNTVPAELPDKEMTGLARISQLMAADLSLEPLSVQFIDPSDSVAAAFEGASDAGAVDQQLVSVEELIDLEQQVDFFMVLGQDEAAVDLLRGQLKQGVAGASSSALPYLKLMGICQQRGDALSFADVAGRYAVAFNASPPAWDANLEHGPGLDGYPEVIRSLQSRWSDSGASMVALQKLLSSKDGRSASFDLPALRDLLLLYSVARDRSEHEVRGEEIDLFLPLEPDLEAGHPTGFDLMATMVWQGRTGLPSTTAPADVDILLDDSSLPDQRL